MPKQLMPDEWIEGEDSVSHEEIHRDLTEGLRETIAEMREKRAQKLVQDAAEWIGRAPTNDEEKRRVTKLRERALALSAN